MCCLCCEPGAQRAHQLELRNSSPEQEQQAGPRAHCQWLGCSSQSSVTGQPGVKHPWWCRMQALALWPPHTCLRLICSCHGPLCLKEDDDLDFFPFRREIWVLSFLFLPAQTVKKRDLLGTLSVFHCHFICCDCRHRRPSAPG